MPLPLHRLTALFTISIVSFAAPTHAADAADAGKPFAAPTELTATLPDPLNIDLEWKDNASNEAGYFVEYSPDANDEYLVIEALLPNSTSYRHPDLLPHTRFVFRVRPVFGAPSNVAELTTGKEAPQQELVDTDCCGAEPPPPPPPGIHSLKTPATMAKAAPSDLVATLIPPAGVKLEWKDNAKDADGYLLEIKAGDGDFVPSSFLERGQNSLISYGFPYETTFAFRIRAFIFGQPTNLAEQTTGDDPTMNVSAAPSR